MMKSVDYPGAHRRLPCKDVTWGFHGVHLFL